MSRYARPHSLSYSFGPGPITPAVKWIIWINVAAFVATVIHRDLLYVLGVIPQAVVERFWVWQPITYMFMHAGPTHILFNMLGIWMFGVELERLWGTKFFVRYYAVTGIGAAITTIRHDERGNSFHNPSIGMCRPDGEAASVFQSLARPCRRVSTLGLLGKLEKSLLLVAGLMACYPAAR